VATLSRGYKRETTGFLLAEPDMNAKTIGDEPLQYKRKFPQIEVAVAENRALGIPQLVAAAIDTQVILLDDAFQHRAVTPGLNIMLTEYSTPFTSDWLLPAGRLREWRSAYQRADVIVVSKCPAQISDANRDRLLKAIKPLPYQQVFFTYYAYEQMYYLFNRGYQGVLDKNTDVLLLSAIARTDYLMDYIETQAASVIGMEFEDHHYFSEDDLARLNVAFLQIKSTQKLILTTEKDAMRLELHRAYLQEKQLPIFVLPVVVQFHFDDTERFNHLVKNYLLNFKV
jgi:tetraacyldisaccharide 4'-kinase